MNRYEEEKMKWDQTFNRCLSDREFGEAMFEKWQEAESEHESLWEAYDELQENYQKAMNQIKETAVDKRWSTMIDKIETILSLPASNHEVVVKITDDDVRMNCNLEGVFGEEDKTLSD